MDEMSHCASFLCLNALFEFSFFRAGHLTAGDETLELAEIVAVLRTAYRVFFENSQMFGATRHWSERKFAPSVQQGTGTGGNSFSANDGTQELAEILSPRTTRLRYWRKFVLRARQDTGTGGNLFSASDDTQKLAEICSQRATRRCNWRKFVHSMQWNTGTGGKQARVLRSKTR